MRHTPVMLGRCLDLLAVAADRPGSVIIDGTLGLGGHSEALLERFTECTLIGIDRDPHALQASGERLARFGERAKLVHAVYDEIADVLDDLGYAGVDGVLFDLGVSSMQLDEADRGFAYSQDAPLDMRMNPDDALTAAEILNTYCVSDLARVLRVYGEEKFALQIARRIVAERERALFDNSARLVDLIKDVIPAPARRTGGNPAKRTFQALRIEVNAELAVLGRAIPAALDALTVGGRVVVMSYQSLEDRIVKQEFAARVAVTVPPDLPFVPADAAPKFRLITKGAEQASEQEIADNPRSAPVRLRCIERVAA